MKILCVSDQIDPLVYSNNIKERFAGIDLILGAGDLPMDYIDFIVSSLNRPMLFVFGNHNLENFRYYTKKTNTHYLFADKDRFYGSGAVHIHGKIKREEGLLIAGLGGCMKYNNGVNQFSNAGMTFEIIKLLPTLILNRIFSGRFLDILLTHASPLGIHDRKDICHRGFKCFLWFMRAFKPRYLVHGHIHLYDLSEVRTTQFGSTMVINAYNHYLIDTEE
ncbi:MAG: metallophosphoesterase [Treponema sp.]|jgi:predicted phosphodiesterase|nr:metallophosphoesterase [Treponema sp.]